MRKSFYQYVLILREPNKKDDITRFAYQVFKDGSFPKTSTDFNEISRYLEMETDYLPSMTIFDQVWSMYQENTN